MDVKICTFSMEASGTPGRKFLLEMQEDKHAALLAANADQQHSNVCNRLLFSAG